LLVSWLIRKSKFGTGLIAIREDEDKAATVGIDTPVYKSLGFAASAVFLGMAGGVYGYYLTFIDPSGMFDIVLSVQLVLAEAGGWDPRGTSPANVDELPQPSWEDGDSGREGSVRSSR